MNNNSFYIFILCIFLAACSSNGQEIQLVQNKSSNYKIVIPQSPKAVEARAAGILKQYLYKVTGVTIPIIKENNDKVTDAIYIGATDKGKNTLNEHVSGNDYVIATKGKDIYVYASKDGKGTLYGIYYFLEKYIGCKKTSNIPAYTPIKNSIALSPNIHDLQHAQFDYCEVYAPESRDTEFRDWHGLDQFEELWGLWGHSFDKLVPAKVFFKEHPEYYTLVKGNRQPSQLCLSNEAVYHIVIDELKKRMANNPDAVYWSVSQNDDIGYCQCAQCKAIDDAEGGPQGSLIRFVNKVAAAFPDKKITTLAYGYTHKPTLTLKPASNVYIFLSDIDAFREKSLREEGSAATFKSDLKGWGKLTTNLFVWDYITEFTNYLAPFPDMATYQDNIKFFKENSVKGVFMQGSGDTYSFMSELKSYIAASLLQDDNAEPISTIKAFLDEYYGKAATFIHQYLELLTTKMKDSHRHLDIYGNPVNEWNSYLTPELIDQYSTLLDKAESAIDGNTTLLERVMKVRLPLDYTVLQQARFYGIEKHGIFLNIDNGKWEVRPKLADKVARFVNNCKKAGVRELSEGGLTPDQYLQEWNEIFKDGVEPTIAVGANITLKYPFAEDYPAKGNMTLIDGNPGYKDFSYNWLCFYGTPMEATIDLGKTQNIHAIKISFLDDPRHWIFLPSKIIVETSEDGVKYTNTGDIFNPALNEHYQLTIKKYLVGNTMKKARYIRVTSLNMDKLPDWRYRDNKKPMIACDEIYIE